MQTGPVRSAGPVPAPRKVPLSAYKDTEVPERRAPDERAEQRENLRADVFLFPFRPPNPTSNTC